MSKRKFRVYLAGPISGCNEVQIHRWRDEVKQIYAQSMDFIDPSEMRKASSYEIVRTDLDSIEQADGLLVNMWRESIGSAIGIVHAHRAGRPVVVANPSHLKNSVLGFYATAMEETPKKAAHTLLAILRADADWRVIKSGPRDDEPFSREKLADAIRAACRSARRDNIVVPALVLPRVIACLKRSDRKLHKQLTATEINEAVMESLVELEANPGYASAVRGISEKWGRQKHTKRPSLQSFRSSRRVASDSGFQVQIESGKSHATIWGKAVKSIDDIPSPARQVFRAIMKIDGITRITLGPFSRKEERRSVGAVVTSSKQQFVIEGKLFDKGPKGTMQTFQVRVQQARNRDGILNAIVARLKEENRWAGQEG